MRSKFYSFLIQKEAELQAMKGEMLEQERKLVRQINSGGDQFSLDNGIGAKMRFYWLVRHNTVWQVAKGNLQHTITSMNASTAIQLTTNPPYLALIGNPLALVY